MRGSDQSRHLGTLFLWRGVYWVQNSTSCKKLLWILWIQGTWFCRCHCWSFPCILLQRGGEWVSNPFVQINVFSFWPYCYKSSAPNYQVKTGGFWKLDDHFVAYQVSWSVWYLAASFSATLPWERCGHRFVCLFSFLVFVLILVSVIFFGGPALVLVLFFVINYGIGLCFLW